MFDLVRWDVMNLAYQLFLERHPEFSSRRPTGTSFARAKWFNKENMDNFFQYLWKVDEWPQVPSQQNPQFDERSCVVHSDLVL